MSQAEIAQTKEQLECSEGEAMAVTNQKNNTQETEYFRAKSSEDHLDRLKKMTNEQNMEDETTTKNKTNTKSYIFTNACINNHKLR